MSTKIHCVAAFFVSGALSDLHLAAFVCAFKAYRRNSIIYVHEKNYRLAAAMGISPAAFKKYRKRCEELRLIRKEWGGNYRFVKLTAVFAALIPDFNNNPKAFKHVKFFGDFERVPDVKTYYKRIKYALMHANFKRQEWNIERNKCLDEITKNRSRKRTMQQLNKLRRKHKVSAISDLPRIVVRTSSIVTGKNHISNIIGCCPATASKLLKEWVHEKLIRRKVIREFIPGDCCSEKFHALRASGHCNLYATPNRDGYFHTKGSEIKLTWQGRKKPNLFPCKAIL